VTLLVSRETDAACPGDEVQHKAEALAFAKAMFPDDRRDNRFFIEAPRRVFARLLSFKPTPPTSHSGFRTPPRSISASPGPSSVR